MGRKKQNSKRSGGDTLHQDEILKTVAKETGIEEEKAKKVIDVLIGSMKKALVSGRRVFFPDFASFQVVEQKAKILRDPKTGIRYIRPVRKVLSLSPEGRFKEEVEQSKLASILLVVPKNDPFARVVDFHFSRVGWRVLVLNSIEECEKMLDESNAYLCIVDYALDGAADLIKKIKCNLRTSMIPVIALFPRGKDPERAETLRVCGDEHLAEPFEIYTLLVLAESELARSSEEEVIFRQQVCLQFPTSEEYIEDCASILSDLFTESGMSEERQVAMNAAVREAILNASQHGNRYELNKQIRIFYLLDREKVTVVVTDEGNGFDYNFYLDRSMTEDAVTAARERYEQGRLGGLGIMLMVRCTDRLEYNDKGNSVTLTKYIKEVNSKKTVIPSVKQPEMETASSDETVVFTENTLNTLSVRSHPTATKGKKRKRASKRRSIS